MRWVRLLWNDGPPDRVQPLLILLDVEFPVTVKVAREVDGAEFDDSLRHRFGPTHTGSFQAVLDQVLAGAFDGAAGNGPALDEVVVIAHVSFAMNEGLVAGTSFGATWPEITTPKDSPHIFHQGVHVSSFNGEVTE